MRSRRCLTAVVLLAVAAVAGCSGATEGSGMFARTSSTPTASAPSRSAAAPASPVDLSQWKKSNTCDVLQLSTSQKVGIQIATPFPQSKGGGCIFGGDKVTYGVQLLDGDLSEVPMKQVTVGPQHFRQNGVPAVRFCSTSSGKLGCYVVAQVAPKRLYYLTHNRVKGTASAASLMYQVGTFSTAVFAGLKAGTMLHPDAHERYPNQQQHDGRRKPGLHPQTDVCNGRILRFSDLPYNGMQSIPRPGPTRFQGGVDYVDYDIACTWDVHDFVKGYTPPAAARPGRIDPSQDLSHSLKGLSNALKNLADIYGHSRVIFVTLAFRNDDKLTGVRRIETTYRQAGRTVIIYKQPAGDTCVSRFHYGKGALVLGVTDSTGGRYGSACTATRSLTRTVLQREPR